MERIQLDRGVHHIVDNGHVVAWTAHMPYTVNLASPSVFGSVSSGESFVCTFTGPGELYVSTHSPQ